ncbi:MAG: hypothetical protein IK048_05275 [Clostridia bacterium]|nr:hypothetical protein [Clostridia bacterium]
MKKHSKLLLIVAIVVVMAMLVAVLTSCGLKNTVENLMGGGNNGDEINISDDYDSTQVEAHLNALKADGVFVKLQLDYSDSDDGAGETEYMAYGAKGDIYFYQYGDANDQVYVDMRSDDYIVVYEMDAEEGQAPVWTKEITYYDQYYTKETIQRLALVEAGSVWMYLANYAQVGAGAGTKSTATVAGRSCDKYVYSEGYAGIGGAFSYSQEYCIDKGTGVCLKYAASVSATSLEGSGSAAVNFEATQFLTTWNPTLPTVDEAHTTYTNEPQNGSSGGNGNQQQGDNQPAASNAFANKMLLVTMTAPALDVQTDRMLSEAYVSLFADGTFEMASGFGFITGSYTVSGDVATLSARALYNAQGEASQSIPASYLSMQITHSLGSYTFPMTITQENGTTVSVTLTMRASTVAPTHSGGNESGEQGEQGGNSEVDPGGNSEGGEGEGGGEVIHIGDETPMYDNYPVATFRDNLSRFFASGLYVEYNYKVEDKTNGNGQFANAHVYAGIKNNIGFVKNEYTGYSAYFEFGDTSVIVHPYDMTAGDYDRTGTEWGYDVLDLDKNGAILYEVFGYNFGWYGYGYDLSQDWANAHDFFQSLMFRYTRRGVNNGAYRVGQVSMLGREQEKFTDAENNSIVIDKETGICTMWARRDANENFSAVQLKTGNQVEITLFEHIGSNPGDENDETTIIASYPHIADSTNIDALIANGFSASFNITYRDKTDVERVSDAITIEAKGGIYHLTNGQNQDEEFIVDFSESEDYYVYYLKEDGVWTAERKYYEQESTTRARMESGLRSNIDACFKIDSSYAHWSGMTKTTDTFLGRSVDKFVNTISNITLTVYVDKATGVSLYNTVIYGQPGAQYTYAKAYRATAFSTQVRSIELPEVEVQVPALTYTIEETFGSSTTLQNKIWELSEGDGIYCVMTADYGEYGTQTYTYWAKENKYSVAGVDYEAVFVMNGDTGVVYYNSEGDWEGPYDVDIATLSGAINMDAIFSYRGYESADGTREEGKFLDGRDVYVYTFDDGAIAKVDVETGICLSLEFEDSDIAYTVTALYLGNDVDEIEVPTVA